MATQTYQAATQAYSAQVQKIRKDSLRQREEQYGITARLKAYDRASWFALAPLMIPTLATVVSGNAVTGSIAIGGLSVLGGLYRYYRRRMISDDIRRRFEHGNEEGV